MQRYNLAVNKAQIIDSWKVFPRNLGGLHSKHTDGCIAKRIMNAPLEHALEHMSKRLMPRTDMKANVEAQRCVDDAPEKEVETNEPTVFPIWW